MQLVAASKLRRAQEATLHSRPYAQSASEALRKLRQLTTPQDHPLFAARHGNRRLVVLFSSDRGLAGSYNTNLFKALFQLSTSGGALAVIVIGQKGAQFVSKIKANLNVLGVYEQWPAQPRLADTLPIARTIMAEFEANRCDEVVLLYTDFVSLLQQTIRTHRLLPVAAPNLNDSATPPDALFEPTPRELLAYIVPRFIEVQIYQASLEAAASEQAMRMIAMQNASDNAKDLTADLTLTYNSARQSAITQELAEIISGAEAMA